MLWMFKSAAVRRSGEANAKNKQYQFWQQENHPIELISNKFINQKLDRAAFRYIHNNLVKSRIGRRALGIPLLVGAGLPSEDPAQQQNTTPNWGSVII